MARSDTRKEKTRHRVVITGVGATSPNGIGKDAFWDALVKGRSGIGPISVFKPDGLKARIAGEVSGIDVWEPIPPKYRQHVPRSVPLAIAAAREALADAGIEWEALSLAERRSIDVVIGSGGGGAEFTERMYQHYYGGAAKKASIYSIPSSTTGTLSSELSMHFGLRGSSHVLSTGCTSSTDAMGYALLAIQSGRSEAILTGGVDATITPAILLGFEMMELVTCSWNDEPPRGSRPFSRDRDGFVLAEGAWFFMFENEERARRRGARMYAEALGYGSTCDAYHRVRLGEDGEEPARAIHLALADAGIESSQLSYVNLHGTSTLLNDRIETRALKLAFGKHAGRIPMSSTKSLIGHPQGASGAAGVSTALCAMNRGRIPPTLNLDKPDPECDLDYVPHESRRAAVEFALCNCIGFGSKNAALVLGRYEP